MKTSELTRILRAAKEAGYQSVKVVIHTDGKVVIDCSQNAPEIEPERNEWDERLDQLQQPNEWDEVLQPGYKPGRIR